MKLKQPLAVATEGIVLFLVLFSAWPFGSVHAYFQSILLFGVALLLALWAARAVLERRVLWTACPVALTLAGMCALAFVQVLPLSPATLAAMSPRTAELRGWLQPTAAERAEADASEAPPATLSLNPAATRTATLQLVAVLALYAVVRNNLREPGTFYRLAWLCAANGVLLALIGMSQLVSSPPNVVFWSFPTRGAVFGPFICRNHFAYYANLCIGLTAGLLLGTRYFLTAAPTSRSRRSRPRSALRELLRDPRVLWLGVVLVVLLTGILASLSRGGALGIVIGGGVAGLLMLFRHATPRWAMTAGVVACTVLFVSWLGFDRVSRRWEQVWQLKSDTDSRSAVWSRTAPLILDYPVWGSGLGTFGFVEAPTRQPGDAVNVFHDHAHNDFLELWIEGGSMQLLVALLIIGFVIAQGIRAYLRHANNGMGRLALGGLAGFIAVTVQSFVDFGLRIPAVALLATVVAAMLANLAETADAASPPGDAVPAPSPVTSLLAFVQAVALLVVAFFLVSAGQRAERIERYRLAARGIPPQRAVAYLQAALASAPDHGELHIALSDALMRQATETGRHVQILAAFASGPLATSPALATQSAIIDRLPGFLAAHGVATRAAHRQAVLAVMYCPLSADAHERLLRFARLQRAEQRIDDELARLRFLEPSDAVPWYLSGERALRHGERGAALAYWRHASRAGDEHLPELIRLVPDQLTASELLDDILPANAALILRTVQLLPAGRLTREEEDRYYRSALALLQAKGMERSAEDHLLQARIHDRFADSAAARQEYVAALEKNPRSGSWRFEFCEFLYRTQRDTEARTELVLLLDQEPTNRNADQLYKLVLRRLAERR